MADPEPSELRRRKLIGRLVLVGFAILLLAYLIPLALNFVK